MVGKYGMTEVCCGLGGARQDTSLKRAHARLSGLAPRGAFVVFSPACVNPDAWYAGSALTSERLALLVRSNRAMTLYSSMPQKWE